jgi:hypothetical protein
LNNPFEELLNELQANRKELEIIKSLLTSSGISQAQPPEIIDTDTLCTRLGITEPTAIRHKKKGLIPSLQIGSAVRYNWPDVVKALEKKKGGKS